MGFMGYRSKLIHSNFSKNSEFIFQLSTNPQYLKNSETIFQLSTNPRYLQNTEAIFQISTNHNISKSVTENTQWVF